MGQRQGCRPSHAPPGPQCVVRPWGRGQGSGGWGERAHEECQDSLLPWGISLELVPPAVVAVLLSLRAVAPAAAVGSFASVPAVMGSASSVTEVCSCCRPPQLALFSPMWPSMVWDRRVSEKRAHSANSGSATYVMKPEGGRRSRSGIRNKLNNAEYNKYNSYLPIWMLPTVLACLSQSGLTSSLCFFSMSPKKHNKI